MHSFTGQKYFHSTVVNESVMGIVNPFDFFKYFLFLLTVGILMAFSIMIIGIWRYMKMSEKPSQTKDIFMFIDELINHESSSLAKNAAAFLRKGSPFPVRQFFY